MIDHSSSDKTSTSKHPVETELVKNQVQPAEAIVLLAQLKRWAWRLGILSCLFGIGDRGFSAFADGHFSADELLSVLMILALLISWLFLKPGTYVDTHTNSLSLVENRPPFHFSPASSHLEATQTRMTALNQYHLISQSYLLPFPYLCQIYHLLNLKHLETIHSFSLNNLKVVDVSHLEQTDQGGMIKFQTVLDSPWNILRIWRQPIVEAKLTLHSPYTVELGIPVYGDKVIIVMFNAIPKSHTEHQFHVDIYSNLEWYKPLLKGILHFASVLTLIEDLPYLQALTQTNIQRLVNLNKTVNKDTTWLFNRFVSLYGSNWSGTECPLLEG
jgi:hypothetical protein